MRDMPPLPLAAADFHHATTLADALLMLRFRRRYFRRRHYCRRHTYAFQLR